MIADHYLQLREELKIALTTLLNLASEMRRTSTALDTVRALLTEICEDRLLVVVMGEAKSGKSSLLNALFGREFANLNTVPPTDRIHIFHDSDEKKTIEVSPQLMECYLPIPFLRDFNVVDTPGTNVMVSEHQLITEDFVPRADLVFFVFSAANPWTQSAWDILGLLQKKWLKNFVFILQQIDLREPTEIEIIRRHLEDTTMRRLGFAPSIFPVSARKALLASTTGLDKKRLWRESNFGPLEEQINLMMTQPSARMVKFRSACQTARVTLDDLGSQVRESFDVIARDEAHLAQIDLLLQRRKDQTLGRVTGLLGGAEQACRDAASDGVKLFRKKLSVWRTWTLAWNRTGGHAIFDWMSRQSQGTRVEPQLEHIVQLLEADLRGLWPQLQDMIDQRLARTSRPWIPQTIPDFARQRRDLLHSIQLALVERIAGKSIEEPVTPMFQITSTRLRWPVGAVAAGGILALIVARSSPAMAAATGGLAASAAVIGTIVALRERRKILRAYEQQMESKRSELVNAIKQQLEHAIDQFYKSVSTASQQLAAFCFAHRGLSKSLLKRAEELQQTFDGLRPRLG